MRLASLLLLAQPVLSQQIYDIWQTTWNRNGLFTSISPASPINFGVPGNTSSANIVVNEGSVFQTIDGFGGSLTDSSALVLNNLKNRNSNNYWALLNTLFNPTDGANAAGFSVLRVPLGASDFSARLYSFDDVAGDTALNNFNINNAPSYLFSVIKDIQSVNPILKVFLVPWSPPAWMKESSTMNGGRLNGAYISTYAQYLLKCLQGFNSKGIRAYSISIQNEPENSNPTYPTAEIPVATLASIGRGLRTLMNNNGFSSTKLIGYDHNWDHAGSYAVQLMQQAGDAFSGVAFHCYAGSVGQQSDFTNAFPGKEVYFTECAGTVGSDWWSDIKWQSDNIWIGSVERGSRTGMMWNVALDGNGNPKLPGTDSCGGSGCRGIVTVNSDGSYELNQEFYGMAHVAKATIPRDSGGPLAKRIGVSVNGSLGWALRVLAFSTGRTNSGDWVRYSLVIMNWNDDSSGGWNPQSTETTISFRGAQARVTLPVGVTTLWWYAPA